MGKLAIWLTPLWILAVGVAIGAALLLLMWGVCWVVNRRAAKAISAAVGEGILRPISYVAASLASFSVGMLNIKGETKDGIWVGELRAEAGTVWHTQGGWQAQAEAEATLERIVLAINDRPIALTAGVSYATANDEAIARVGARVVLMHRNDKRVNLKPLSEKRAAPPPKPVPAPKPVVAPPPPAPEPIVEEPPPSSGGGGAPEDQELEVPKVWEL